MSMTLNCLLMMHLFHSLYVDCYYWMVTKLVQHICISVHHSKWNIYDNC